MIKHLITATLFVLGGAGFGLVGYLATEPLAFTYPVRLGFTQRVREPPPVAAERSPEVILANASGSPEAETNSIWLAEVRITAAPPRAGKRTVSPVVPARFDPCSEWRDVGALVVDRAGATGVRNVPALCPQPDIDR
jgi:hypothetical protein